MERKEWGEAGTALRRDCTEGSKIGCIYGTSLGSHERVPHDSRYSTNNCEYLLAASLRMKAPKSLILRLLAAYLEAANDRDADGHFPREIARSS